MATNKAEPLSEVLVQAKLSLDSALARMQGGEEPESLTEAQLQKVQASTSNTSCTNTGCGKKLA